MSAARIPSALDATLLVIAVYLFFRKLRRGVEVDAALITASCAGMIGYARAASMDMPLASSFGIGMLGVVGMARKRQASLSCSFLCLHGAWNACERAGSALSLCCSHHSVRWRYERNATGSENSMAARAFCCSVRSRCPGMSRYRCEIRNFFTNSFWSIISRAFRAICITIRSHSGITFPLPHLPWCRGSCCRGRGVRGIGAGVVERTKGQLDRNLIWNCSSVSSLVAGSWCPSYFSRFRHRSCRAIFFRQFRPERILLADYLATLAETKPIPKWLGRAACACRLCSHRSRSTGCLRRDSTSTACRTAHVFCGGRCVRYVCGDRADINQPARLRMLRFVTLIPVVLAVAAVLKLGTTAIDQKLSTRPLAIELASVETHKLPIAVCGVIARIGIRTGVLSGSDRCTLRKSGDVPAGEHLLVAPTTWMDNVAKATAGRHVSLLGHYAPQKRRLLLGLGGCTKP